MDFAIDRREAEALLSALDSYLPELEHSLSRVPRVRDRHELVVQDELLIRVRDRLRARLGEGREESLAELEPQSHVL
jgi:hypothetical protein